jgi:hypothetical protein
MNVKTFLSNHGDPVCWVPYVSTYVAKLEIAASVQGNRAYFFFTVPPDSDSSIEFDGVCYQPADKVKATYKTSYGAYSTQCFTPFFDAYTYLNSGYDASVGDIYIEGIKD